MLYKTRLPFLLAFNKNDILREHLAMEWMKDYDKFKDDCTKRTKGYIGTLTKELGLALTEFYSNIHSIGVSAVSGFGMEQLFSSLTELREEYYEEFYPLIQ